LSTSPTTTVDPAEIQRFAAIAEAWWDPEGKFKPLHRLNPTRIGYIRSRLELHFGRDTKAMRPFEGLRLVDIGCGGGLVAEPMARLGFSVTAIDAAEPGLAIAEAHAESQGLVIDYRQSTAEDLAEAGEQFDVVLALEIVEHVADPAAFFQALGQLVRPGGAVVVSTLNRTFKSFALAKVGAEYLLRWVPRGTHSWPKFLKPSEVAGHCRSAGLTIADIAGISYEPFSGGWALGEDLDINYMLVALKPVS
jgi:2-polyprenyl-6-hydroxyphenyl methylase/3-demethylubiquinone-9 3-methyltransferase